MSVNVLSATPAIRKQNGHVAYYYATFEIEKTIGWWPFRRSWVESVDAYRIAGSPFWRALDKPHGVLPLSAEIAVKAADAKRINENA